MKSRTAAGRAQKKSTETTVEKITGKPARAKGKATAASTKSTSGTGIKKDSTKAAEPPVQKKSKLGGAKKNNTPKAAHSSTTSKQTITASKAELKAAQKVAPKVAPKVASKVASKVAPKVEPKTPDKAAPKVAPKATAKAPSESSKFRRQAESKPEATVSKSGPHSRSARPRAREAARKSGSVEKAKPYVSTLPEFEDELDLLSYFGIELFEPSIIEKAESDQYDYSGRKIAKEEEQILDFAPGADSGVAAPPSSEPESASPADIDPIEELAKLLATAEEADDLKLNLEMLHTLREEDIALKEVEITRLTYIAFAQIKDAVVDLKDESHALVIGNSQAFFHDRSTGKLHGENVYAFVYDHATVESDGSRVIAAGRSVVYARGGWIGAKDEAIVHARGDSKVEARGDAIIVAEDSSVVEAFGTVAVMLNSPQAKVRLLSEDACVIVMDPQISDFAVETLDRSPPKVHQLVSLDSPLGLEKMMELSFREAQRKEKVSWDYR